MKELTITNNRGQYKIKLDDYIHDVLSKLDKSRIHIFTPNTNRHYAGIKYGKQRIGLHRFILGVYDTNKTVDHIDGDSLNNQTSNIRVCTQKENTWNTKSHVDSFSKYKGVSYDKKRNKWMMQIMANGIKKSARFNSELEAAMAYNTETVKMHGEYARINILNV